MKNHSCKLVRELQMYQSANRLLITGTPLQNNLSELWSLLNFLMPEVFDKLESFESWFDFSELKQKDGYQQIFTEERTKTLVASLHAILKPFLLRRIKADVEKNLPKKREYVLFAPLEPMQRELYQAILDSNSRSYLEEKMFEQLSVSGTATPNSVQSAKGGMKRKFLDVDSLNTPNKSAKTTRDNSPASTAGRSTRSNRRKDYSEVSDSKYFAELEDGSDEQTVSEEEDEEEKIFASTMALVKREIGNKKLQNPVMQLRLCCNSPHIFYNPYLQPDGTMSDPDDSIVTSSGKMRVLDALLPKLFKDGHKVLIFSQFKSQLDILQDYAWLRGWPCCRIDGEVPQSERASQIEAFNTPSTAKNATNLFLLSTRAGGQGINLTAADTVVLFDSDWNPQQDLQAQDRVHRIGQTRNVIIYRLATRGTVEQGLLEKAEGKRRLEKLVIQKGSLKDAARKETLEELKELLSRSDGEQWEVNEGQVLSERDLKILTDRSEEAYVRAETGEDEGLAFKAIDNRTTGGLLEKLQG
jgi:ATP-dependent DNA helicase